MNERWGQNGQFGTWEWYWQDFTPKVGMCVEGVQWGEGNGEGKYTQVSMGLQTTSDPFETL